MISLGGQGVDRWRSSSRVRWFWFWEGKGGTGWFCLWGVDRVLTLEVGWISFGPKRSRVGLG